MEWLSRLYHPSVNLTIAVVSLLVGIYLYLAAQKTRELTYYVHPIRTTIVQAKPASSLRVYHEGQELTTPVTAVQVQVWNQGREAIKKTDVLEPLVLSTADGTRILEAAIRQQTRPKIVRLSLDTTEQENGRLGVSWELLEEQDGGIIQLILAGTPAVRVHATAVLKGQRGIRQVIFPRAIVSPEQQYEALRRESRLWVLGVLLGSLVLAGISAYGMRTERQRADRTKALWEKYLNPLPDELLQRVSFAYRPWWQRWVSYAGPPLFIMAGLIILGFLVLDLFFIVPPRPPLDF